MNPKNEIPMYLLKMGLGTLATRVAGLGLDYLIGIKHRNANLSSSGNSGGNDPNDSPNWSMNDATSNSTHSSPNVTDPYYQPNSQHDSQNNSQNNSQNSTINNAVNSATSNTSGWSLSSILKALGYATSIGVPTIQLLNSLLGNGKSSNTNKNTNTNTVKPTINTTVDPKFDVNNEVDVDNEVDYTPSSFHNFVPTINIHTPDYSYSKPMLEINQNSSVFVPYEPGYKSKPRQHKTTDNPVHISTDWLFKNHYSAGFANI